MANYTQKAIIQTFEDMLHDMPFDKITVSAIVSRCDISSNTFYYHFHDIYDLLEKWLDTKETKYFDKNDMNVNWEETLKTIFHDVQDHPDIVNHIFNSISRERLERYAFDSVEATIYQLVQNKAEGSSLSEESQKMIASICCYTLFGFLIKFIWNGMSADVDQSIDQLGIIFEKSIEYIINNKQDILHI
ncbi:MAG: TetR/AcrR family transcriptional regulator C-terminal domain-containing protein [Longibaculum sp.]